MELKLILEAILFSAQKPLSLKEIRDVFAGAPEHAQGDERARALKRIKEAEVVAALEALQREHEQGGRSFRLACVAGSWQFVTEPQYAPWLKALVGHKARAPRLSQPALETLAIVAYRQPVTRAEVEQVRGVAVDGVMQTLLERGLIDPAGRAEVVGRPMTYGTTPAFLEYFGLRSLEDLPAADKLRRVPTQKPEGLATVKAGLATAPPEQLALPAEADAAKSEAGGRRPEAGEQQALPAEAAAPVGGLPPPGPAPPETNEPGAENPQTSSMHILEHRKAIDKCDAQLITLLNERTKHVLAIGEIKRKAGDKVYAPHRERAVLRRISRLNHGPITNESLQAIYREVMSSALSLEKTLTIAYLGPRPHSPTRPPSSVSAPACIISPRRPSATSSPR